MDNYFVSVLVPVYGVEQYIERCCRSLFEQTYENVEYIFVDDCSKDRSVDIIMLLLAEYPSRAPYVKMVKHPMNMGLGAARNTAVDNATGAFVIHVDSDDYIDRNMIRMMVEEQMHENADVVSSGRCIRLYSDHNTETVIESFASSKSLNLAVIKHEISNNIWGRLIRKSLYTDNDIHVEPGINMSEDLNVLPRLLYNAATISSVPSVYYYECSNQNSYTSSFSEDKADQAIETLDFLSSFFEDKGVEYKEALSVRRAETLIKLLKNSVKSKGHQQYYHYLKSLIADTCEKEHLRKSSILDRLLLHMSNYEMVRIYVLVCVSIKRIL